MRILLIVLTIIAVTIIILRLIKAKVEIFFGETKRVVVKLLWFIFDTSDLTKKEKKKKVKKEKKKKGKLLFFKDFCRIAGKAIKVFNNQLIIRKLKCVVLVATDDAAKTAMRYGKVSAGVNIFCGAICNNFNVIERDIRVNADFIKQKSEYDVYVNMYLSLFAGVLVAYAAAVCAIRAIINNKKIKAV